VPASLVDMPARTSKQVNNDDITIENKNGYKEYFRIFRFDSPVIEYYNAKPHFI
jgi:hypothetical protein